MDHINNFFTAILKSSLINQLTEYNTNGFTIGNGSLWGSIVINLNAPKKSITDAKMQLQLQSWIKTNQSFPKPGANSLYFIYTDIGVTVSMGGSKSCSSFCGYHNATKSNLYYAVMPYPGCSGCLGGLDVQDALTATSSHELCEAITDPVPGSGWYDERHLKYLDFLSFPCFSVYEKRAVYLKSLLPALLFSLFLFNSFLMNFVKNLNFYFAFLYDNIF